MKVGFGFTWTESWQRDLKIPKGFLLIKPVGPNILNLGKWLNKLTEKQAQKEELIECECSFDVHYVRRTRKMNDLMWGLYEIEAVEHNGGKKLKDMTPIEKEAAVLVEELYQADIEEYAPVITMVFPESQVDFIRETYRHIISEKKKGNGDIEVVAYFSTSHMNTKQHGEWIERQFSRLSAQGVHFDGASEIGQYWVEYAAQREPDTESWYTASEYKERQQFCEAEPTIYLGNGGGSLAHIVARGMGRNPMEAKYHEADVMHLSDPAHALWDNGKGRTFFMTRYPHLKKKIEAALNKEIDTSQQDLFADVIRPEEDPKDGIPIF